VAFKCIYCSAINVVLSKRIPFVNSVITKCIFPNIKSATFFNNLLECPLLPPLSISKNND